MWQESNRSTHNHNTHEHTSRSYQLVAAVSVCCDRVASTNQCKLTVVSLCRRFVSGGGGARVEGLEQIFQRLQYSFPFVINCWFMCKWFHHKPEWREAEVRTCICREARESLFQLTVLLEDIVLRVLRLLASVTTMAEGKRDGWEYWGGSCLWEYTAIGIQRCRQNSPCHT